MNIKLALAILALAFPLSFVSAATCDTDERYLGSIKIALDGKITVFASGDWWQLTSCSPLGSTQMVYITPTQNPRQLWLSALLMAKMQGRKVKLKVDSVSKNMIEVNIL